MITLDEAKKQQTKLQATAQQILDHYKIEEKLKTIGQVHRVGSFEYGFMVRPDIDFEIINQNPTLEPLVKIAESIMLANGIGKVSIHNQYIWPEGASVTRSIYLGIKPVWGNIFWQIDVHVMKPDDRVDTENFHIGWQEKLTEEQRNTILYLKANLFELGHYSSNINSVEVYKAVISGKAKTIEELYMWKQTQS
jgi:hypothetical protein